MPYTWALIVSYFLMRVVKKGDVEIIRKKVYHDAYISLEVPCLYSFYGPKIYVDTLGKNA